MDNAGGRFVEVEDPQGGKVRMLLPRQHDGGWPYSREMLDKIAQDDGSVLITGETGTGKELLAYYLRGKSRRSKNPFVAVNCSGFTEQLMRAELFGSLKGSYTGADRDRKGLIPSAEGGTIFLDEIGNMDPSAQGRLLRFMQTREIEPVGGQPSRVDVRVIAATNKDVGSDAKKSALISDLYHRFRFRDLTLPALSDRQADIFRLLLEPGFLGMDGPFSGITLETMLLLAVQAWPGNMRELKEWCERARLFSDSRRVPATVALLNSQHDAQFPEIPERLKDLLAVQISMNGSSCYDYPLSPKISKQGPSLPNHILHDCLLPIREDLVEVGLDFCLRFGSRHLGSNDDDIPKSHLNTLSLLWSLNSVPRPFVANCLYVPEEHILPLAALHEELDGNSRTNGAFDFRKFDHLLMSTDRFLPVHWETANCGIADAIANMAHYCRKTISVTNNLREDPDGPAANRFDLFEINLQHAETLDRLPPLPRKWEMPKPPQQEQVDNQIEEMLAKLDFSRCRNHEPETIRRVLQLRFEGAKPNEIRSRLNDALSLPQIKGILRTYQAELQKLLSVRDGGADSPTPPKTGA